MTIEDNGTKNQYTATSSQTTFPYTFEIFDSGDISVLQNGVELTISTDYIVHGVGDESGGNVILFTGATTGDILTLYRDMALERLTDYQNSGDFLADDVNTDYDRVWAALQQIKNALDSVIRPSIADTILNSSNTELAEPDVRANTILGFDSTGDIKYRSVIDDAVGINEQTGTSYTTVLADAGSLIIMDNASANTITIPPDVYSIGAIFAVRQKGVGQTTIVEGSGVTIVAPTSKGLLISEQGELVALVQESTNYWSVTGGLTA
ncbi:MAG: hypothetical protein GY821_12480 [Gammaproteobacteria bacterium]|nr:hypothetical protein [Gammaproteobacteria bacterium]